MTSKFTPAQAKRRYFKVFIPAMICYLLFIFAAEVLERNGTVSNVTMVFAAVLPGLAVFAWMWAQARWLRETDEFIRQVQVEGILVGLMITMGVVTGWGLLEFYTNIPRLPVFYVMPMFYFTYGIATGIISRRRGAGCAAL